MLKTCLAVALLLAWLAASCGDSEELQPSPTATATVIPSSTPAPTAAVTEIPPTPSPAQTPGGGGGGDLGPGTVVPPPNISPPPIPENWRVFEGSKLITYSFRYPDTWYLNGTHRVSSWDPAAWTGPRYPPGGVLVEVQIARPEFAEPRPTEATDTTLAGLPAWEVVRSYDSAASGGITRLHSVTASHAGYVFSLIAYFAQDQPDETTFSQILNSVVFE